MLCYALLNSLHDVIRQCHIFSHIFTVRARKWKRALAIAMGITYPTIVAAACLAVGVALLTKKP